MFAAIGREILRYLEVPPHGRPPIQIITASAGESSVARIRTAKAASVLPLDAAGAMPDLRGRSLRHALALLAPLRMEVEISGHGVVSAQDPEPGVTVEPGMAATLSLVTRAGRRAGE